MCYPRQDTLRARAPYRVLDGFGRAVRASCHVAAPRSEEEVLTLFQKARAEGLSVTFRGAGRSYGDASVNSRGVVLDMRGLDGMLNWDPVHGIAEAQGGLTIEGLWRRTLEDGYWPAVVPGTMFPTLAGCVSMNIHGKNHFKVGPFGEQVLELDLLTPTGQKLTCSRQQNADVFRGVIAGMGLLGAVTRVKLKLKKVHSGRMRVRQWAAPNLEATFDAFEEHLPQADYLVSWTDCITGGSGLGRSQIHRANYLEEGEDPEGKATLHLERQVLPPTIFGVPRSVIPKGMVLWRPYPVMQFVNWGRYITSRFGKTTPYLESHVAFAFLLDYVPNWRLAYGPEGFIQVQIFVPRETARAAFREVLQRARQRGLPSHLGVMKRHRPDDFLLSHALDGYSLAMDFRVTQANRADLWKLAHELHEIVIGAGGRFYFAKDAVLSGAEVQRSYDPGRLAEFAALKRRLDPEGLLETDLSRRALGIGAPESGPRALPAPGSAALPAPADAAAPSPLTLAASAS